MSIWQTLVSITVLATSSVVFAQTTETKPPDVGNKGGDNGLNQGRHGAKVPSQVEILTDTMGVDFGPYLADIKKVVRNNWLNLLPRSVYPPMLKQGKVSIGFFIQKNGNVDCMQVDTSSGDVALDRAAWASITASNPFPHLPTEFSGQNLGLRFYYFYNLEPTLDNVKPTRIGISISPSADVRVLAGSTIQVSASGKGITDDSVGWRLSGHDCSKSDCGTISLTGLYTAPLKVPSPPTVQVEAVLRADPTIRTCSLITIVQTKLLQ